MKIKFLKGDPRAGDVVQLDSSRAQQFIDEGRAVQVNETTGEAVSVASRDTAADQKSTTVKKAAVKPAGKGGARE